MSLLVLCPSKGRPAAARECWETFAATKTLHDTSLVFILNDDEDVSEYQVPYVTVPRREWMNEVLGETNSFGVCGKGSTRPMDAGCGPGPWLVAMG
jgi:hypothetical protein